MDIEHSIEALRPILWILQDFPDIASQEKQLSHPLFQQWQVNEFLHRVRPTTGCQPNGHRREIAAERQVGVSRTGIEMRLDANVAQAFLGKDHQGMVKRELP
jgi:hypothetical protein